VAGQLDVDAGSDDLDMSGDPDWSLEGEGGNFKEEEGEKMSKITFDETKENVMELVDSWGIVKWGEYGNTFSQFWEEKFVKNVRSAVKMKFMSRKGGAALLGLSNVKPFNRKTETTEGLPALIQDMVDSWDIVKKDAYLNKGKPSRMFWKESFVNNVLFAVHIDLLSVVGGALLLGVGVKSLKARRRKEFGVKDAAKLEIANKMEWIEELPSVESEVNNNKKKNGVAESEVSEDVDASCHEDVGDDVDPLSLSGMSAEHAEGLQSMSSATDCMKEEDRQTCQEMEGMVHSWGVVKWNQLRKKKKSFAEFCEEPSVKNVMIAVQLRYLTRNLGTDVLGVKNKKLLSCEPGSSEVPVIIQDMIARWGIVKKDEFQETGKTANQFWKETFVRKVLCTVQVEFLTCTGAASLLGVSVARVQEKRKQCFGKTKPSLSLMRSAVAQVGKSEDLSSRDVVRMENETEDLNVNWWERLPPPEMENACINLEKIRNTRMWILFLQFSHLEMKDKKAKFNPYKAGKQEVADFLQLLQLTGSWPDDRHPETCLASLSACLPDLSLPVPCLPELMSSHPPTLATTDIKLSTKLRPVSPYDSTWSSFAKFCENLAEDVDPFLAKPVLVREFLVSKFGGKEMRLEEFQPQSYPRSVLTLEKEPFFRPAHKFYADNLDRLLSELDWHLEYSWLTGPLKDCQEMESLITVAVSCDERLLTDDLDLKGLVLKFSPNYSYTKVRTNHSEELFWGRKFTENVLNDVRKKVLPVSVAAKGLGVTAEMVWFALKQETTVLDKYVDYENPSDQDVMSVKDYVFLGYGGRSQFWKEESTVELLENVRNRIMSVERLAALVGVSRREILERCGGVKDDAEMEAEKTLEVMEKMKQQGQQQLTVKKKKSQLEIQIEIAEKHIASLSEYERMRLKNMKERQAMLESLDIDKDKQEMKALTHATKNTPRQVEAVKLRERSARVKRRSEEQQLRKLKTERDCSKNEWLVLQENRSSPKWFGHWVPRSNPVKAQAVAVTDIDFHDVYDLEAIAESNHIPKFELRMPELLEVTPSYHKSKTLLDSFSADFKQVRAEEKLIAKPDWSRFELLQDNMVSSSQLTSLDTCSDYICFGTKTGGVGVSLAGRAITIRPHNRQVTRTLLMGKSNPGILSAALDGTVRMTDLVRQTVNLEYCWDQSFSGKQGVRWLEERGVHSFLLDCGGEINQIDIRSKEAVQLFELSKDQAEPTYITNLSVNPTNKNLISLCRGNSLEIWDLRKASGAMVTLPGPSGSSMAGGGWSVRGSYLVTCVEGGYSRDMVVVYNGLDFSQPILTWEGPRKMTLSPPAGVTWCPWQESVFLTTMEQVKMSSLQMEPKHCVVAVDCVSGSIVGELCSGLDSSSYMLHCSKSREVVVVGNTKGPGGMAVYKGN